MKKITLNLGDYGQYFKPIEPVKRSYKKTNTGAKIKAPKSSSKNSASTKAPRNASNAKGTSIKTKTAKPKKAKKPTKKRRTPEEMAELRQQRFEAKQERDAQKIMREMERDAKQAERNARAIMREAERAERLQNQIERDMAKAERFQKSLERDIDRAEREWNKIQRGIEREEKKAEREQKKTEREAAKKQKIVDAAHKKVEERFESLHKPGNPNYKNELADLFTEKILMLEKGTDLSELNDFLRINTPKTFKESYVDLDRAASLGNEEKRVQAIREMFENYIDNTTEFGAADLLKDLDKFENFNYQGMRYANDDEAYAKIYHDITSSQYVSDDVKAIMALMPKNVAVNFYKNYRDLQILANGGYRSFEYDLAAEDYYTKDKNIEMFDKTLHKYTKKGSRKEIGGISLDAKNFLRHIIGNMTDIKQVNEFLKRVESTTSMDVTNLYIRDRRRKS